MWLQVNAAHLGKTVQITSIIIHLLLAVVERAEAVDSLHIRLPGHCKERASSAQSGLHELVELGKDMIDSEDLRGWRHCLNM